MQIPYDQAWYIVYTKRLLEKKVVQQLTKKKIPHYCPMIKAKKRHHNKITVLHQPLFPSYVFVQTHADHLTPIKKINGVLSLVHRYMNLATVTNEEIAGIRNFLERYDNIETEKIPVSFNHPHAATAGRVIKRKGINYFANLELPSLGSVLRASISVESVRPADVLFLAEEYQAFPVKIAN